LPVTTAGDATLPVTNAGEESLVGLRWVSTCIQTMELLGKPTPISPVI